MTSGVEVEWPWRTTDLGAVFWLLCSVLAWYSSLWLCPFKCALTRGGPLGPRNLKTTQELVGTNQGLAGDGSSQPRALGCGSSSCTPSLLPSSVSSTLCLPSGSLWRWCFYFGLGLVLTAEGGVCVGGLELGLCRGGRERRRGERDAFISKLLFKVVSNWTKTG